MTLLKYYKYNLEIRNFYYHYLFYILHCHFAF